jgi:hypothetical protein
MVASANVDKVMGHNGPREGFMNKKKKAFELFNQGFRPGDEAVKKLKLAAKTRYAYFQIWKKSNLVLSMPGIGSAPTTPAPTPLLKGGFVETGAAMETQLMKFIAHTQEIPLTVNMVVSYGCAVVNGYEGTFGDWLNLVSLDFWSCRGRDMFAEMGGVKGDL